jgi:hypothetical protein
MSVALARQAPYPVRTAQRRCGKCGKLVARSAYACRRCGKSQRVRPRVIWLSLAGAWLGGMFAVASAGSIGTPGRSIETAVPSVMVQPAALARALPAISAGHLREISAVDLWRAYSRDAAGADQIYRDHPVVVSGTVHSVERDFEGRMIVRLTTGDAFETVNATMDSRDNLGLAGLAKGRAISLQCEGRGRSMGAPLLGACSVR